MALTLDRHADGSARWRLGGDLTYPVEGYVVPLEDRFRVTLLDLVTGKNTFITSASSSSGGIEQARQALISRAAGDGIETRFLQVVVL